MSQSARLQQSPPEVLHSTVLESGRTQVSSTQTEDGLGIKVEGQLNWNRHSQFLRYTRLEVHPFERDFDPNNPSAAHTGPVPMGVRIHQRNEYLEIRNLDLRLTLDEQLIGAKALPEGNWGLRVQIVARNSKFSGEKNRGEFFLTSEELVLISKQPNQMVFDVSLNADEVSERQPWFSRIPTGEYKTRANGERVSPTSDRTTYYLRLSLHRTETTEEHDPENEFELTNQVHVYEAFGSSETKLIEFESDIDTPF